MKPFNLERALAGDPVVTHGRKVCEIIHLKLADPSESVVAVVDISGDGSECYTATFGVYGTRFDQTNSSHPLEMADTEPLEMADTERMVYINTVAPREVNHLVAVPTTTYFFETYNEAMAHACKLPGYNFYAVATPYVIKD